MEVGNLNIILDSWELTLQALLYSLAGLSLFAVALRFSGVGTLFSKVIKYCCALGSVGFTSSFFTLLLHPSEFYSGVSGIFIVQTSFVLIVICIAIHELLISLTTPTLKLTGSGISDINHSPINDNL